MSAPRKRIAFAEKVFWGVFIAVSACPSGGPPPKLTALLALSPPRRVTGDHRLRARLVRRDDGPLTD